MADWHIDLGFDRNATLDPDTGTFDLQWGAVSVSGGQGTPASLTQLSANDTIEFNIYDVTSLNHGSGSSTTLPAPTISSGWLFSVPADTNTQVGSPFQNMNAIDSAVVSSLISATGTSSIFPGTFPQWQINQSGGLQLSAVVNNPNTASPPPPACFALTFTLHVSMQTFSVDPEMIVQP